MSASYRLWLAGASLLYLLALPACLSAQRGHDPYVSKAESSIIGLPIVFALDLAMGVVYWPVTELAGIPNTPNADWHAIESADGLEAYFEYVIAYPVSHRVKDARQRIGDALAPELLASAASGDVEPTRAVLEEAKRGTIRPRHFLSRQDADGLAPIHLAIIHNYDELLEWLLANDVDLTQQTANRREDPPLLLAIRGSRWDWVPLLLSAGADPNQSNRAREVPLQIAAAEGRLNATDALLSAGAKPNDNRGHALPPLHAALAGSHKEVAQMLLKAGADPALAAPLDNTPLHFAHFGDLPEVISALENAGAQASPNLLGLWPADMKLAPAVRKAVQRCLASMDSNGDWRDAGEARLAFDRLRRLDGDQVVNALAADVVHRPETRIQTLLLAVRLGIRGSEEKLNIVLQRYGTTGMAEDFLNSGSSSLADGGRQWARDNGYEIRTGAGSHRARWGHF